jgi:hypothetical protein
VENDEKKRHFTFEDEKLEFKVNCLKSLETHFNLNCFSSFHRRRRDQHQCIAHLFLTKIEVLGNLKFVLIPKIISAILFLYLFQVFKSKHNKSSFVDEN